MEAGPGILYREQITLCAPDIAFYANAKRLLTVKAGRNKAAAVEIIGYFDEMIGWRMMIALPVRIDAKLQIAAQAPPGTASAADTYKSIK